MLEFFKRLFTFFIVSFILLNTLIYFILNSETIQYAIVEYINTTVLSKYDLNLKLGNLSLNIFSGNLNLNQVTLSNPKNSKKTFNIQLNEISLSFNVPLTYLKRFPILNKIVLRGINANLFYDSQGNIIIPDFLKNLSSGENDKVEIPNFLNEYFSLIPGQVDIINSKITIGEESTPNYQNLFIDQIHSAKKHSFLNEKSFDLNVILGESQFKFPWLLVPISLEFLKVKGSLGIDGKLILSKLETKNNFFDANLTSTASIKNDILKSSYIINLIDSDVNAENVLKLVKLRAKGNASLKGILVSGKNINEIPEFNGKINWKNFKLQDFNVFSGNANIWFKNREISYRNANIKTDKDGVVFSSGKFELYDNYYFENFLNIQSISFLEVLNSLNISKSIVDCRMVSKNTVVKGYIFSPDPKKDFEINAKGDFKLSEMKFNFFSDHEKRKPMPEMDLNLTLDANSQNIIFTKNIFTATNGNQNLGKYNLNKGIIDLTPKAGPGFNFDISGENVELSSLEYFLNFKSSGIAKFNGIATIKPGSTDLYYKAVGNIHNAELYGLKFSSFNGAWGIDPDGIWTKNSEMEIEEFKPEANKALIKASFLKFYYKDSVLDFNGKASGNIGAIIANSDYWVPYPLNQTSGHINTLDLNLKGPFFKPWEWNLKLKNNMSDFIFLNGTASQFNLNLDCVKGVCSRSSFLMTNINNKYNPANSLTDPAFIIFKFENISKESASMRGNISNLPLSIFSQYYTTPINGLISANLQTSGLWNKIHGYLDLFINKTNYNNLNIGNYTVHITDENEKMLKIKFQGLNNQIYGNLNIPQGFSGDSSVDLNLNNFDPTNFLPKNVRQEQNLFSQISGSAKFSGPLFLKNTQKNSDSGWSGEGAIEKIVLQGGKLILASNEKLGMKLSNNKLNLNKFSLNEVKNKLITFFIDDTEIDFTQKTYDTRIELVGNLNKLEQSFNLFGPSEGSIKGNVKASGTFSDPKLIGIIEISGNSILFKDYPPELKNVDIKLVLKDKAIEIQTFNASKGVGTISAIGSIDYSTPEPKYSVNFSAHQAEVRLPIPIFQIADMELDANISLNGDKKPYTLSGDLNILRLRMFKDINCNEIGSEILNFTNSNNNIQNDSYFSTFNINIYASNSVNIQSQCIRAKLSTNNTFELVGNTQAPLISGGVISDGASLYLSKTKFDVRQAEFNFTEGQKYDPNVIIRMESKISSYRIFMNLNGRLSSARLELSIIPATLPNGDRITQADIVSIISSGQIPLESNSVNLLSASTDVFSFMGIGNVFFDNLNNTISTVTGGLVDNFSISPTTQNGQLSWRVILSRSVSSRLNLGISYEDGVYGTTQSAYATFLFNDTVSAISSYNRSAFLQQPITSELFSGLRFRFGSK